MHLVCGWQFERRSLISAPRFYFMYLVFLVVSWEDHKFARILQAFSEFYFSKIQMFALTILLNILMQKTCLEIVHGAYFLFKAFENSSYLQLLVHFC